MPTCSWHVPVCQLVWQNALSSKSGKILGIGKKMLKEENTKESTGDRFLTDDRLVGQPGGLTSCCIVENMVYFNLKGYI